MHTFRGSSLYQRIQNLIIYQSLVSSNCVVINHQKGEIVSAYRPLVGFGELNDNTIEGLISLISVSKVQQESKLDGISHNTQMKAKVLYYYKLKLD